MYEEDNIEVEFLKRPKKNPFRTPDHYFDSLEDRIMGVIEQPRKSKNTPVRIINFLKPALGLVASLTIVFLLVNYSMNSRIINNGTQTQASTSLPTDPLDNYSLNLASIDDNTLANAIFSDEAKNVAATNPDEVLAYLASNSNDVEIYSEIQK